jgi:hypothetical protein
LEIGNYKEFEMGLLWKLLAVMAVAFSTEMGRNLIKSLTDRFWKNDAQDLRFDNAPEIKEMNS